MSDPIRWDDPASLEEAIAIIAEIYGPTHYHGPSGLMSGDGPKRVNDIKNGKGDNYWEVRAVRAALEARNKPPQPCCSAAKELADFKREVSEAALEAKGLIEGYVGNTEHEGEAAAAFLSRFIQPEPVKVDPVQECLREAYGGAAPEFVAAFKNALAKRGLTITEGEAK